MPPAIIQSYRLETPIAEGGFGRVWRAVHQPTGRTVAVKVLRDVSGDDRVFRAEAAAVASLHHPNIVEVIDAGVTTGDESEASGGALVAGAPWLVMEWVAGGSLKLDDAPMPMPALLDTLTQVLGALAHAHARGVLHLDLKPTNLLCDRSRSELRVVLTDFGAARMAGVTARDDAALLTPGWSAPEVLLGHPWEVGRSADLYAVGVLAWRLATGHMPVEADAWEDVVAAHALGLTLQPPPDLVLPPGFVPWVERLLAPTPADRFAHATLARRALDGMAPPVAEPADRPRLDTQRLRGTGVGVSSLRRIGLVGRDHERAVLRQQLDEAIRSQRVHGVTIRGEAGVGKSHLARWIAEWADETLAAQVVRIDSRHGLPAPRAVARALELDGVPFRESTRRLIGPMRHIGETLEDAAAVAATLSPRSDDDDLPPTRTQRAGAWRRPEVPPEARPSLWLRALEATAPLRPLVLVIDDVDRDDDADRWFAALAEHPTQRGVLFVCTQRDTAAGDALPATRWSNPWTTIPLGPLAEAEATDLLQQWIGLDASTSERIARITRGNPLFATELVREWIESEALYSRDGAYVVHTGSAPRITENVREVWTDRVERVVDAAGDRDAGWQVVQRAAVLGAFVRWDEWQRATAEFDPDVVDAVVTGAWRQHLWRPEQDGFVFCHPLAHEVVVDATVRSGQARGHHLACASAITEATWSATIRRAEHLIAGGRAEPAWYALVGLLRREGFAQAPARLTRVVSRLFELATRLEPDAPGSAHVEARLWDATLRRHLQGRRSPPMGMLDDLVALADEVGTPRQRERARVRRVVGLLARRRFADAEAELRGLTERAAADPNAWWVIRTRVLHIRLLRQSGRVAEALDEIDALHASGDTEGWFDQAMILQLEHALSLLAGDPDRARRAARQLARDASARGRTTLMARARHVEALALHAVGRRDEAIARLNDAVRVARSQQLPELSAYQQLRDAWTRS